MEERTFDIYQGEQMEAKMAELAALAAPPLVPIPDEDAQRLLDSSKEERQEWLNKVKRKHQTDARKALLAAKAQRDAAATERRRKQRRKAQRAARKKNR